MTAEQLVKVLTAVGAECWTGKPYVSIEIISISGDCGLIFKSTIGDKQFQRMVGFEDFIQAVDPTAMLLANVQLIRDALINETING